MIGTAANPACSYLNVNEGSKKLEKTKKETYVYYECNCSTSVNETDQTSEPLYRLDLPVQIIQIWMIIKRLLE